MKHLFDHQIIQVIRGIKETIAHWLFNVYRMSSDYLFSTKSGESLTSDFNALT